jgi:lysine 2,3-aminomutase
MQKNLSCRASKAEDSPVGHPSAETPQRDEPRRHRARTALARRARLAPAARLRRRHRGEWRSAQWQRAHCVKNVRSCAASTATCSTSPSTPTSSADQAERATMSMLLPPQMLNTMVPDRGADDRRRCYADPVRRYMLPVFSDRRPDWPPATPTPPATRCTSTRCGSPRGSPTATPPRCSPSCSRPARSTAATAPGWTWSATRRPPSQAEVRAQAGRPARRDARLPARTPASATSSSPAATSPTCRVQEPRGVRRRLLEIDNIRDIRLATKALMGLPQHWLQDDVVEGMARLAATAARARRLPRDAHPRQRTRSR